MRLKRELEHIEASTDGWFVRFKSRVHGNWLTVESCDLAELVVLLDWAQQYTNPLRTMWWREMTHCAMTETRRLLRFDVLCRVCPNCWGELEHRRDPDLPSPDKYTCEQRPRESVVFSYTLRYR